MDYLNLYAPSSTSRCLNQKENKKQRLKVEVLPTKYLFEGNLNKPEEMVSNFAAN